MKKDVEARWKEFICAMEEPLANLSWRNLIEDKNGDVTLNIMYPHTKCVKLPDELARLIKDFGAYKKRLTQSAIKDALGIK